MLLRKTATAFVLCLALAACESSEDKAQAYYESGLALLEEGDVPRAQIEFRNALAELPTHTEARMRLAGLSAETGNNRAAFRHYRFIVEQNPGNVEALVAISRIAFLNKEWSAFERYAPQAIENGPDTTDVRIIDVADRFRRAAIDEDLDTQNIILAEAQALEPEAPDDSILRQLLITGYLSENDYEKALEQVNKAIEENPAEPDFYSMKIRILALQQNEPEVEQTLRDMVAAFPDEAEFQGNLLRFLLSRQKMDAAEDFLRQQVESAEPAAQESARVDLLRLMVSVGRTEEAFAELDAAVAENPKAYLLRTLRASLTFDTGDRPASIEEMQAIIEEASNDADSSISDEQLNNIKVALASMLLQTGNEVGARRQVEEILTDDGTVVGALKLQARWMIQDDDTDGAVNAMRTALAESPQDIEAMTIMAEAYQRAGNTSLMFDFLSLAVETSNNAPEPSLRYAAALRGDGKTLQAESTLISSLRIQPDNLDVLRALGIIYVDLEDEARARQVISTLKRMATPEALGAARAIEVELLSRNADTGEVLSYLEGLSAENTSDNGIKLALIRARLQNDDAEAALSLADELVAENPDNANFSFVRGLVLASTGDFETAEQTFAALVEDYPNIPQAWLQLVRLRAIDATPEEMAATFDAGLAANPDSPSLLWAKASFLQQQDDIEGAIAIYEDLYAQESDSTVVANNLASLLTTYRRDEESLERARTIARRLRGTEVPAFQDTYGWIQHRTGNSAEALTYLEPAAEALRDDAAVQYHLGEVYMALERRAEALVQFQKALEKIGPGGSRTLTDTIQARIAELEAASDN